MWNDTDAPLAYLITFRTYGTWLHGDKRGSVDRKHNAYGTPRLEHDPARKHFEQDLLQYPPVKLDVEARMIVEIAIKDTCRKRLWELNALNVRTNHAHAVVRSGISNSRTILNALKANSTRLLRERGWWQHERSPWVEKGSRRHLWNEESVTKAVEYVLFGQEDGLPSFD